MRLDKWLWCVRLYKTRAIAQAMIQGGKVHHNQQRCKPSRQVQVGDEIRLTQGQTQKTIHICALQEKRTCAEIAQACYQETDASKQARMEAVATAKLIDQHTSKPNKKERRKIILMKNAKS
jgi:ribosome-associated heat shock protein Hsp15